MARYEFKLPDIGEGIAEAEIVAWHVKVGDTVGEDQQLADMMTDKATVEMESPVAGKVLEVAGEVGDMIAIGSVLVVIETEGEAPRTSQRRPRSRSPTAWPRFRRRSRRWCRPPTSRPTSGADRRAPSGGGARRGRSARRRMARPQGAAGRRDWRPAVHRPRRRGRLQPPARSAGHDPGLSRRPRPRARSRHRSGPGPGRRRPRPPRRSRRLSALQWRQRLARGPGARGGRTRTIKVVGLRRKIAENMQEAKRRIPHFTLVEEYDVTALEQTRAMMNADRGDQSEAHHAALPDHARCAGRCPIIRSSTRATTTRRTSSTAPARCTWAWRRRPIRAFRSP